MSGKKVEEIKYDKKPVYQDGYGKGYFRDDDGNKRHLYDDTGGTYFRASSGAKVYISKKN